MGVKPREEYIPNVVFFSCNTEFKEALKTAIRCTSNERATGIKQLIFEVLKITPGAISKPLCNLSEKCSQFGYILRDWITAPFVPVHEKGYETTWRTKVRFPLHGMLGIGQRGSEKENVSSHRKHLQFLAKTGCEPSILRHGANITKMQYGSCWALRGHNSVLKDNLMDLGYVKLPESLANMIAGILHLMMVRKMEMV